MNASPRPMHQHPRGGALSYFSNHYTFPFSTGFHLLLNFSSLPIVYNIVSLAYVTFLRSFQLSIMTRIFSMLILLLTLCGHVAAQRTAIPVGTPRLVEIADETLTYDVIYKWGFINKVAGYATMSLRSEGDLYHASLFARNAPWANSIYMLRDTLYTTMTRDGLLPQRYIYIAHEAGKYKKDVVDFSHNGNEFSAVCTRIKRPAADEPATTSTIDLQAQGMTVDMLSAFFYLRALDFGSMSQGSTVTLNIFSGSKKELLTITYLGRRNVELGDGSSLPSFYINFSFTRHGQESSAPIEGWISADSRRIPVKVEGQLPVGKVRALYTGPNP